MSGAAGGETSLVARLWRRAAARVKPVIITTVLLLYLTVMLVQSGQGGKAGRSAARGQAKIVPKSRADSVLMAEFTRRKKVIKDSCEKFGAFTSREKVLARMKVKPGPPLSAGVETDDQIWPLLKKTSHHQFFLQKEHGLLWCKVPKAASTSWLHAFLQLTNVPESQIPEDNGLGLHGFLRDKYPLQSKNLLKQFLPMAIKFLVVRHPFQRVVSAYTDKLESYSRDLKYRGGYYYAMYGADIVQKLRPKYQEKFPKNPLFMRKEPSFVEFVEYLIETPISQYDEHWKPQFMLCPPCNFRFDVIVKMETFERDTNFILSQRDLTDVISLSKKHSSVSNSGKSDASTKNKSKELFSQLSKNMVKALHEKYRVDFDMFEYDVNEYLEQASESAGMLPDTIDIQEEGNENLNIKTEKETETEESL